MINISTEGKDNSKYVSFINECVVALFPEDADYDIFFEFKKFVDDDGTHAGFCLGDDEEAVISIASHWIYEGDEEVAYEPHEIASHIAHELVHAKQFYKGQINMQDNVWKRGQVVIDCDSIEYNDLPWEVEAYQYEAILTDLLWENV